MKYPAGVGTPISYFPKTGSVVLEISDNVLGDEDMTFAVLHIVDGVVASITYLQQGAYSVEDHLDRQIEDLNKEIDECSKRKMTEVCPPHPENFYNLYEFSPTI